MRSKRWAVLVTTVVAGVSAAAVLAEAAPAGRRVLGRVTDEQGKPIAGAQISAWSGVAGQLRDAAGTRGQTDAGGRFDLRVAFGGVRYTIWVRKSGYETTTVDVLSGDGQPIEVKLKRQPLHTLSGSVVDSATHKFARGAKVILVPEYAERREATTDEGGRFQFEEVPEPFGQGVIYAELDGRFSAYQLVRGRDYEAALVLGPPAKLEGVVVEQLSAEPMADCVVTARPHFMSGFSIETRTDKDGRFRVITMPPGDYCVGAERHDLYQPPNPEWKSLELTELPLAAGQDGFLRIELRRRVAVKGRVLRPDGKPVADASVGMPVRHGLNPSEVWGVVKTDEQGRFSILTGRVNERETIEAFSAEQGRGRADVSVDEELPDEVTIRLSGMIRVRGVVTDEKGTPMKGIHVGVGLHDGDTTGADGRFDLGRIPLTVKPGDDQPLVVRCPRPYEGGMGVIGLSERPQPARAPAPDARFFLHQRVLVQGRPGHEADLKITLKPAPLLTFSGRVLDPQGKPAPKADVILFAGNANPETWDDDLHPARLMISSMARTAEQTNMPLARTVADEKGQWTMWAVRETDESLRLVSHQAKVDASRYSLGAESPAGQSLLLPDIILDADKTEKQIDIELKSLPASAAGGAVSGQVVDAQGNPMPDVGLRISPPMQTVTTDAQGRFAFAPRPPGGTTLWVQKEGWGILSPEARRDRASLTLMQPETDLRIVIGKVGTLRGTVRWESGKPVTSFDIVKPIRQEVGDGQGAFSIERCPPGQLEVRIRSAEGVFKGGSVYLPPGGEAQTEIALPDPDCTIRGQVRSPAGEPIVGRVKVTISGPSCETGTMPDEQGRFVCHVPPGSYRVTARSIVSRFARELGHADVTVGKDAREAEITITLAAAIR